MKRFTKMTVLIFASLIVLMFLPICTFAKVPSDAVEYNGHYYKRFDTIVSWKQANAACNKTGGHLVTITSAKEQKAVVKLMKGGARRSYWMGGKQNARSYVWEWNNTWEPFGYSNWGLPNQPDGSGSYLQLINDPEECGGTGYWDDTDVNGDNGGGIKDQGYICEWDSKKAGWGTLKHRRTVDADSLKSLKKKFKDLKKLTGNGTFKLTGLVNTHTDEFDCCDMTPQGICEVDGLIYVTAYCSKANWIKDLEKVGGTDNKKLLELEKDHKQHNSVIYVISEYDGNLLKTIVLPDNGHVGGIAYDGDRECFWLAGSTNKVVYKINRTSLEELIYSSSDKLEKYDLEQGVSGIASVSFLTYFENRLWIGQSETKKSKGDLKVYKIRNSKGLINPKAVATAKIPARGNGLEVYKNEKGQLYLFLNKSPNRKTNSTMYIYKVTEKKKSGANTLNLKETKKLTLPPMIEEISISQSYGSDTFYTLFESGAAIYSTVNGNKAKYVTDLIYKGKISSLI